MKHCFQPYPIEMLELDPIQKIGEEGMLITAGNTERANAMTAGWGGLGVLWGMKAATIYVRESRFTKEFLDREGYFSLSFLGEKGKSLLKYFGTVSGRNEDKFKNARETVDYDHGIPFPDSANLVLLCRKLCAVPILPEHFIDNKIASTWYAKGDYHVMYAGEVLRALAR